MDDVWATLVVVAAVLDDTRSFPPLLFVLLVSVQAEVDDVVMTAPVAVCCSPCVPTAETLVLVETTGVLVTVDVVEAGACVVE